MGQTPFFGTDNLDNSHFSLLLDKQPNDWELRLIYADYLEETGDLSFAKVQRWLVQKEKHPWLNPNVRIYKARIWASSNEIYLKTCPAYLWYSPAEKPPGSWTIPSLSVYTQIKSGLTLAKHVFWYKAWRTREEAEHALCGLVPYDEVICK